jgi:homopolymeric O-antigen transport system permease protein
MVETVYSAAPELRRPRHFLALALADLRRARPAAWALFLANLRAQHRRAWLGYLWLLIPALATAGLCALMQSRRIVAVGATDLPYPLFVLSGMVLWQAFLDGLNGPLEQLGRARQVITRSAAPHEAVIGAGLLQALLGSAIRLAVLAAAILLVFRTPLAPSAALFPLGLLALLVLGLSAGLLAAPLGLLYDDVSRALFLGAALLFFLTPVAYPLPSEGLFRLNPVAILLGQSRAWLTGGGLDPLFAAVVAASLAALVLAWLFYRLARPHTVARLG